ncbi:hypothetical protein QO003_001026 [Arthrobacter silviterrae]|uniref:Hedgehog/Intein (Hint) domain-containing protein n=1 Tax=Arthrobacter silviterrae TaxID=2026658 RepID=A0ABX0DBX5_9MICC|nr:hypothetical protein [Arthrobacter silviterrae]MDQ0276723.1 hypothetical protein [Arthrobacter silviterrae]NGN84106.1 hypothetical protein [Arthrobacter silviterrae]
MGSTGRDRTVTELQATPLEAGPTIRQPRGLRVGDTIESWRGGRLEAAGIVSRTLPSVAMAWIVCARTGTLKLVDQQTTDLVVVAAAGCGTREGAAPGGCRRRQSLRAERPGQVTTWSGQSRSRWPVTC